MPGFRVTLTRGMDSRDITAGVLELRWRLGMARPFDSLAAPARGRIVMLNRDGSASPELDDDGLLAPGTSVLIECDFDGWQPMFTGAIAVVVPDMGEHGPRRTLIELEGADALLTRAAVQSPVLAGVRAGEALDAILDPPPLGAIPRYFDVGASVFAYVGDRWSGLTVAAAARQLAEAERGRVFLTRAGTLAFRSRHAGLSSLAPDATFDAEADSAEMAYGALLANQVRVGLRPRWLGEAGSTLWTLANAQRLRPAAGLKLTVPLRDSQGRRAGAVSVITPVAGTDFTANNAADGSGTDATADVSIAVLALEGGAAKLRFENASSNTVYLMPGTRLRGTPLLGGQPAAVEASDEDGIAAHGLRALSLSLPLVDSVESAHDLAAWELSRRADPAAAVHTLTLSERARYADALALTLFGRVRLIDPHTAHDGLYDIVAEAHEVSHGGRRHTVIWTLEPAPPLAYWTVGVSALGTETVLAI